MVLDMIEYTDMMNNLNIDIVYSGPMWQDGIKGIADMVESRLATDDLSESAAMAIFSVFIEQVTNVLMYSAEKRNYNPPDKETLEVSAGMLVLGQKGTTYFIQTGNLIKTESLEHIKNNIDHLNMLDKKELRKLHKERLNAENDNPESKGAGLGLIEIARKSTAPIGYKFDERGEGLTYFTMYVEIGQIEKGGN